MPTATATITATSTTVPDLKSTYATGISLQLYAYPPPDPPADDRCNYARGAPRLTKIEDRFDASITKRIPLPAVPATVSITLRTRLVSSMRRIPHVWTAQAEASSSSNVMLPSTVVAKIYDPVYTDEAAGYDPFSLRDLTVSNETEAYRRLESIQGVHVPHFFGHFLASLPSQKDRTVNVVLMEYIDGRDIRDIVPAERERQEIVCGPHKSALIDAAIHLYLIVWSFGVVQVDMQPRNVILRRNMQSDLPFCSSQECPLRLEMDCENFKLVMVDLEMVEFKAQDSKLWDPLAREVWVQRMRPEYFERWLINALG